VFQKLLEMVPHLQERLTESSELEEYMTIADSVRLQIESSQIYWLSFTVRFKKVCQAQDRMTPRVSRGSCWNG